MTREYKIEWKAPDDFDPACPINCVSGECA